MVRGRYKADEVTRTLDVVASAMKVEIMTEVAGAGSERRKRMVFDA